jgi:hypothetical protein
MLRQTSWKILGGLQRRQRLREMTFAAIFPILALHKTIQNYRDAMRRWV